MAESQKRLDEANANNESRFSKRKQSKTTKAPSEKERILNGSKDRIKAAGKNFVQSEGLSQASLNDNALNSNGSIPQIVADHRVEDQSRQEEIRA